MRGQPVNTALLLLRRILRGRLRRWLLLILRQNLALIQNLHIRAEALVILVLHNLPDVHLRGRKPTDRQALIRIDLSKLAEQTGETSRYHSLACNKANRRRKLVQTLVTSISN